MRDRRAAVPYLVATLEENVCVKSQCFIDCRCPYLFAISTDWSMSIDELIAHCVCLCYNAPASWDSYNYAYNWPCRIHSYRATSNPNQIAAVLTAKGRIAAATYRIMSAHAWYSLYFTIGLYVSPRKKIAPPRGDPGPMWFPSSTQVHAPNGISIGSAVSAQITVMITHRPRHTQQ